MLHIRQALGVAGPILNLPPITQQECAQTGTLVSETDGQQFCQYANGFRQVIPAPLPPPIMPIYPSANPAYSTYPTYGTSYANMPYNASIASTTTFNGTTLLLLAGGVGVALYLMNQKGKRQ